MWLDLSGYQTKDIIKDDFASSRRLKMKIIMVNIKKPRKCNYICNSSLDYHFKGLMHTYFVNI